MHKRFFEQIFGTAGMRWTDPIRLRGLFDDSGGAGGGAGAAGAAGGAAGGAAAGGAAGGAGDGAGGGDDDEIAKLRKEAAKYRTQLRDAEKNQDQKLKEFQTNLLKGMGIEPDPNKNYEQQVADANKAKEAAIEKSKTILLKAEVKAQCLELGLHNDEKAVTAMLALVDRTKLTFKEEGDSWEGVKAALEELAKTTPWLKKGDGKGGGAVGGGSNPGAGGGGEDPEKEAREFAAARNKGQQQVAGGLDPWAKK